VPAKLLILSIAPSIFIALYIYFRDKYEKEPFSLLLRTFLYGILVSAIVVPIEHILMVYGRISATSQLSFIAFEAFIVAGLTEEYFKRFAVIRVAYNTPYFDEPFDGIVYCVFSAVGFAAIENIGYVSTVFQSMPTETMNVLILRGIMAVPAHAMFGVVMGYYLGFSKFAPSNKAYLYYQTSLILPMIFHGFYDFILMLNLESSQTIVIIFEIALFLYCLRLIKQSLVISKIYFR